MKKLSLSGMLILLSLSLLAYATQTDQTQSSVPNVLKRQVTVSDSERPTAHSAFLESLVNARVPGGIVTILNCGNRQGGQQTHLSSGTLKKTLDAIVKANPEYRWQVDDGIINLLVTHGKPELLDVQISKLKVDNAASIEAVADSLFALPEVKDAIAKLQLAPGVHFIVKPISLNPERKPTYSIECENMTVREALNAIVRTHGRSVWEYKEQRCDGKTEYTLQFIAQWL